MVEGADSVSAATDGATVEVAEASEVGSVGPADTRTAAKARFRSATLPSGPFWIALLLVIFACIVFVLSASALFVFGVGVAMAFFLVPVVGWLERRGMPRWVAAILTVVGTLIVVIALLGAAVLIILNQGIAFIENLPLIREELDTWYASLDLPDWLRAGIDAFIVNVEANLGALDQGSVVAGFLGDLLGLLGGLFAWFLLPFFLFYLLKDQPRMSQGFYERVPLPWKDDVSRMLTISVGNFAQYFRAEIIVGSIMFVIVTVGMFGIGTLMDVPQLTKFAILLGFIALVMELIPQIGPIISYIPALLLSIPAGFETVAVVSVFYFIVFNIEGSILVPNLEGKMIDFSGASVLVLIAIGFALGGIIGAILALPLASIIRDLFRHFFDQAVERDLVIEDGVTGGPGGPGSPAPGPASG